MMILTTGGRVMARDPLDLVSPAVFVRPGRPWSAVWDEVDPWDADVAALGRFWAGLGFDPPDPMESYMLAEEEPPWRPLVVDCDHGGRADVTRCPRCCGCRECRP